MSCRLEAFPIASAGASVVVVSEQGSAALRATLESLRVQQLAPHDITIATDHRDIDEARTLALQVLTHDLARRVVVRAGDHGPWDVLPGLVDECPGGALAVINAGEVLAPDFLLAAQSRFAAEDGDTIAAIAIRMDEVEGGSTALLGRIGQAELSVEDIVSRPETPATCFVYRREALHRVGGWAQLPPASARWDLHIRLVAEWRIVTLPSHLLTQAILLPEQRDFGRALRSQQLRQVLKRLPDQLGLLLVLTQQRGEADDREARLHERIDRLSHEVHELTARLARFAEMREGGSPPKQDGDRVLRVS